VQLLLPLLLLLLPLLQLMTVTVSKDDGLSGHGRADSWRLECAGLQPGAGIKS